MNPLTLLNAIRPPAKPTNTANGSAAPQTRFCTASANAKTSRPHPFACDSGVRKKPNSVSGMTDL